MANRQLIMINNSGAPISMAILQQGQSEQGTLVWQARYAYPGTQVQFGWDDQNFCFVWSVTSNLDPGTVIQASQVVSASVSQTNAITLSYDQPNRSFFFKDQRAGQQLGTLQITQDSSLPVGGAAVGIGMAGKPTFVVGTRPNVNVMFTPQVRYLVLAGNFQEGQFVDLSQLSATELVFPPNVWSMKATLNQDGSWHFEPNVFFAAADETA